MVDSLDEQYTLPPSHPHPSTNKDGHVTTHTQRGQRRNGMRCSADCQQMAAERLPWCFFFAWTRLFWTELKAGFLVTDLVP